MNGNRLQGLRFTRVLIYLGGVVLVFLCGVGVGLTVFGRPAASPAPAPELTTPASPTGPVVQVTLSATNTRPAPTPCVSLPNGWERYEVQAEDTLSGLAQAGRVPIPEVMRVNCLTTSKLSKGQILYLPPQPTATPSPTPCRPDPPPEWENYPIQEGDTLFRLANERGVTVEAVMGVNCLTSTVIVAGIQTLYLPPRPTPVPTATPLPTPTPVPTATPLPTPTLVPAPPQPAVAQLPAAPPPLPEADALPSAPVSSPAPQRGVFSRRGDLPGLTISAGQPNDPTFEPCATLKSKPWISVETEPTPGHEDPTANDLQRGQRAYYFACEFFEPDKPVTLTAEMTWPNGRVQPLDVLIFMPTPELQMGQAEGVVIWNALCNLPLGPYTLTIKDNRGRAPTLPLNLNEPDRERILTLPQAGAGGTVFQIYYCGYQAQAGRRVQIELLHAVRRLPGGGFDFEPVTDWSATIYPEGWARQVIPSYVKDPSGPYHLKNQADELKGWDTIWILP